MAMEDIPLGNNISMNAFCNSKEDKNGYLLSIINNFHIHSRDFFLSL